MRCVPRGTLTSTMGGSSSSSTRAPGTTKVRSVTTPRSASAGTPIASTFGAWGLRPNPRLLSTPPARDPGPHPRGSFLPRPGLPVGRSLRSLRTSRSSNSRVTAQERLSTRTRNSSLWLPPPLPHCHACTPRREEEPQRAVPPSACDNPRCRTARADLGSEAVAHWEEFGDNPDWSGLGNVDTVLQLGRRHAHISRAECGADLSALRLGQRQARLGLAQRERQGRLSACGGADCLLEEAVRGRSSSDRHLANDGSPCPRRVSQLVATLGGRRGISRTRGDAFQTWRSARSRSRSKGPPGSFGLRGLSRRILWADWQPVTEITGLPLI